MTYEEIMQGMEKEACPCGFGLQPTKRRADASKFPAEGFREALSKFQEPSDREIEPYAKKWVEEFLKLETTDQQLYDFMVKWRQCEHCAISSFVSQLCNVGEFYIRPDEKIEYRIITQDI